MPEPSSPPAPRIIVTGATSIVGRFLLARLLDAGYEVHAISRDDEKRSDPAGKLTWHQADIGQPGQLPPIHAQALIHLAPLWLLPPLLPVLGSHRVMRVIGFGSTSIYSKAHSADESERLLATQFVQAEEAISRLCEVKHMDWTIFRPTLVYDCLRDRNITRIATFVRRYGFFPLLGKAAGLRQPVHADDLAHASMQALWQPATFNRAYNLSGGETLAYREMVKRIFDALGNKARFLVIPSWLFRTTIACAKLLPMMRGVNPEMAMRMNVDLCFDHAEAAHDFGFSPRPFSPDWSNIRR